MLAGDLYIQNYTGSPEAQALFSGPVKKHVKSMFKE